MRVKIWNSIKGTKNPDRNEMGNSRGASRSSWKALRISWHHVALSWYTFRMELYAALFRLILSQSVFYFLLQIQSKRIRNQSLHPFLVVNTNKYDTNPRQNLNSFESVSPSKIWSELIQSQSGMPHQSVSIHERAQNLIQTNCSSKSVTQILA